MEKLTSGKFFGTHYQKSTFEHIILTDTSYTESKVDWHYHENAYFTFLLNGKLFEHSRKESYQLTPGSLLFHNWQDAHYNTKPPGFARGFHVEINESWFSNYDIQATITEGSIDITHPLVKSLMSKIYVESKLEDDYSKTAIETLLLDLFGTMKEIGERTSKKPFWVSELQGLILEEEIDYSLGNLSSMLGIHPVHLSREFSRYFQTSLGNYIRLLKLNKAFQLLTTKQFSMTEICYQCGFYDQSHFIASFKRVYHTTPTKLLREIEAC